MIVKLAALGTLGYFGYRYYEQNKDKFTQHRSSESQLAVAGGPLSERAEVQPSGTPAADWPNAEPRGTA